MRLRNSLLLGLLLAPAGVGGTFAVLGPRDGSWPAVLSSVGHIAGPAAEAVVANPKDVRPPRIKVPMAILVINRLIVYVLPIAVVTFSLARDRVESVTSTCNGHFVAR